MVVLKKSGTLEIRDFWKPDTTLEPMSDPQGGWARDQGMGVRSSAVGMVRGTAGEGAVVIERDGTGWGCVEEDRPWGGGYWERAAAGEGGGRDGRT